VTTKTPEQPIEPGMAVSSGSEVTARRTASKIDEDLEIGGGLTGVVGREDDHAALASDPRSDRRDRPGRRGLRRRAR